MPPSSLWIVSRQIFAAPTWRIEPLPKLNSAVHRKACGPPCGIAARAPKPLYNQGVDADGPILDTIGVGQYGPRGFMGGETLEISSTSRVSTCRTRAGAAIRA